MIKPYLDRQTTLNIAATAVALALILLLSLCLQALFTHAVPPANKDVLLVVVGMLTVKVGTVVDFFFGSSDASKQQADTIKVLAHKSPSADKHSLQLQPGEAAQVTASEDGTRISEDN